jgi:S-formylglutathione hydrolase FrmB
MPTTPKAAPLRLAVDVTPDRAGDVRPGRLLVVLTTAPQGDPLQQLGRLEAGAPTVLGRDVADLKPGAPAILDAGSTLFPIARLADLPAGTYRARAVLACNPDLRLVLAPGNLASPVVRVEVDPSRDEAIAFTLSERLPADPAPADSAQVRHLEIPSPLLTAFHGRPMTLRAGVILPRGFDAEPDRRYPLRVEIGGFGTRAGEAVAAMMRPGSRFRSAWNADDAPRFVLLHLDGAGPMGDPYQVNSANHGPYGDAVTRELIPEVERRFRGLGTGDSRVLTGGSTGGWVALALQVFYPESFNGAWGFCPDPLDFRDYQLVNLYEDANAYVGPDGAERPAARDPRTGRVRYTMRRECGMENALGLGGSFAASGGQWGSWNATFGPRGADGRPRPAWDPATGAIDREVVRSFRAYDLRDRLETNWKALGPKLRGKLHIHVGTADDFFLERGVRRMEAFLKSADPPAEATVLYGEGRGHCWQAVTDPELLRQMAARTGARP